MITTLGAIRDTKPCKYSWKRLLKSLGRSTGEVSLMEILDNGGPRAAFWALQVWKHVDYCELIADILEPLLLRWVKAHPENRLPVDAIATVRAYANGDITRDELARHAKMAYDDAAAYAAAYSVCGSAESFLTERSAAITDNAVCTTATIPYHEDAYYVAAYVADAALAGYGTVPGSGIESRERQWAINGQLMRDFIVRKATR